MSSTTHPGTSPSTAPRRDLAQIGLAAVTAVVGAYTIYDASTLQVGFADPVGPRLFPYAIGTGLLVTSALLVVAALRGDLPEAEGGEDVDLDARADWATVAKLVGIVGLTIATVGFLGWAISGAILFAGSTWALGSRTLVRDVIVGVVLSVLSWYAFYVGLGIPLSAGILDGIL
ncbi:tripartite tricarboxylate transporter TctB family protein [Nocardioides sp. MAH-18]|uniref:Tripartite tricarboxylate transporter TctB family protein n=1 Tax=Nocardioides agri TaxID=2682843 RepID=A0A6L6XL90_9ACTN|nr:MULTISPECIES: tripartite tricarboxylate transporter TctB family protein [unclassified Nocardioides]MBA2953152.1 tripartite tricarboxylate transporter TctB family protein [Nocardioides sp. CGMCC 1.13656]MVQ48021.1 tripartite tricarboxylate transporter TctB family protein [Nocardioides sp. MAH-18]